ncbi:hypothetical protein D3C79_723290 [compost metagenome]
MQPDQLQIVLGPGRHGALVQQAAPGQLMAEEEVLGQGQVLGQVELLMNEHYARLLRLAGGVPAARLAIDADHPGADGLVTGEDLHQGGLARAILPQQAVDPPRRQAEVDPVQHPDGAEVLADAAKFDTKTHRLLL